jgi:hypothetical protein
MIHSSSTESNTFVLNQCVPCAVCGVASAPLIDAFMNKLVHAIVKASTEAAAVTVQVSKKRDRAGETKRKPTSVGPGVVATKHIDAKWTDPTTTELDEEDHARPTKKASLRPSAVVSCSSSQTASAGTATPSCDCLSDDDDEDNAEECEDADDDEYEDNEYDEDDEDEDIEYDEEDEEDEDEDEEDNEDDGDDGEEDDEYKEEDEEYIDSSSSVHASARVTRSMTRSTPSCSAV